MFITPYWNIKYTQLICSPQHHSILKTIWSERILWDRRLSDSFTSLTDVEQQRLEWTNTLVQYLEAKTVFTQTDPPPPLPSVCWGCVRSVSLRNSVCVGVQPLCRAKIKFLKSFYMLMNGSDLLQQRMINMYYIWAEG